MQLIIIHIPDNEAELSVDDSDNIVDKAINNVEVKKDLKPETGIEHVENNKRSNISKKYLTSVKQTDYDYDEDEEYGFNQGSYVLLSYNKIKTNQYNISAKILNSYDNPVKKGEITVYFDRGYNKYPEKTLRFKNGTGSFVQKFHTTGRVRIYSKDTYKVLS